MDSETKEDIIGYTVVTATIIVIVIGFLAGVTALTRLDGSNRTAINTQGNTRYIVKDKPVFGKSFLSHFNPFDRKNHYTVEVQKYKPDNNGVPRWQYEKTVDYGTHKPNIVN